MIVESQITHFPSISLDCGKGTDIAFTTSTPRINLQFQGQQGDAVLFRFVRILAVPPATDDPSFRLNPLVVADQFGKRRETFFRC